MKLYIAISKEQVKELKEDDLWVGGSISGIKPDYKQMIQDGSLEVSERIYECEITKIIEIISETKPKQIKG